VIDVAVGEQDRGRLEAMACDDLLDAGNGVLAGVDDHAFLAGRWRDDIAVSGERTCWEPCDEHRRPLSDTVTQATERTGTAANR
jgi:hypothetical protein